MLPVVLGAPMPAPGMAHTTTKSKTQATGSGQLDIPSRTSPARRMTRPRIMQQIQCIDAELRRQPFFARAASGLWTEPVTKIHASRIRDSRQSVFSNPALGKALKIYFFGEGFVDRFGADSAAASGSSPIVFESLASNS